MTVSVYDAICSAKWQATFLCAAPGMDRKVGIRSLQRGCACGQRVLNPQPEGGAATLGTSPARRETVLDRRVSAGVAARSARV